MSNKLLIMNLQSIKETLIKHSTFHSEIKIFDKPTIVGYEKEFRMSWMATQLNTFIVATEFGDEEITIETIKNHLKESFAYAKKNNKGLPRGIMSGIGVISILISSNVDMEAKYYCRRLKSGKKWAASIIPVVFDSETKVVYEFDESPLWGGIYYSYFKDLIRLLK